MESLCKLNGDGQLQAVDLTYLKLTFPNVSLL